MNKTRLFHLNKRTASLLPGSVTKASEKDDIHIFYSISAYAEKLKSFFTLVSWVIVYENYRNIKAPLFANKESIVTYRSNII